MIRLSAMQKAACDAILRAWLIDGEDRRYILLADHLDLYDVKSAIEYYVLGLQERWVADIIVQDVHTYGRTQVGFTLRWPADKARDQGFAAVPPVPEALMQWDDGALSCD